MKERIVVGQFIKCAGSPPELTCLTVIEEKAAYGGGVCLARTTYDVDFSKKWGYIFNESGGGGSGPIKVDGIYHVAGSVAIEECPTTLIDSADNPPYRSRKTKAIRTLNRTRRLRALPKAFRGDGDLLEWLERNGIQDRIIYCSACSDCMPSDNLCKHCWWCEKIAWYSTPTDRCGCATRLICDGEE